MDVSESNSSCRVAPYPISSMNRHVAQPTYIKWKRQSRNPRIEIAIMRGALCQRKPGAYTHGRFVISSETNTPIARPNCVREKAGALRTERQSSRCSEHASKKGREGYSRPVNCQQTFMVYRTPCKLSTSQSSRRAASGGECCPAGFRRSPTRPRPAERSRRSKDRSAACG
jgi:hypothetical protein